MLGSPTNTREATPFRTYIILYCNRDGIADAYPAPGTEHRRPTIVPGPQGQTGPQRPRSCTPPFPSLSAPPHSSPFARLLSRSLLSCGAGKPVEDAAAGCVYEVRKVEESIGPGSKGRKPYEVVRLVQLDHDDEGGSVSRARWNRRETGQSPAYSSCASHTFDLCSSRG